MRSYEVATVQAEIRNLSEEEFAELRPNPALLIEPCPSPPSFLRDTTTRVKVQLAGSAAHAPPPSAGRLDPASLAAPLAGHKARAGLVVRRHLPATRACRRSTRRSLGTTGRGPSRTRLDERDEISCERIVRSEPPLLPEGEPLVLAQVVVIRAYYSPAVSLFVAQDGDDQRVEKREDAEAQRTQRRRRELVVQERALCVVSASSAPLRQPFICWAKWER